METGNADMLCHYSCILVSNGYMTCFMSHALYLYSSTTVAESDHFCHSISFPFHFHCRSISFPSPFHFQFSSFSHAGFILLLMLRCICTRLLVNKLQVSTRRHCIAVLLYVSSEYLRIIISNESNELDSDKGIKFRSTYWTYWTVLQFV